MRSRTEDDVLTRLFSRRRRRFQMSLLWLLMVTGVAPVGIYVLHRSAPSIALVFLLERPSDAVVMLPSSYANMMENRSNTPPIVQEWHRLRQIPLWVDLFPLASVGFLVAVIAFGALPSLIHPVARRPVAIGVISTSAAVALIAVVIWAVNGDGGRSVLAARGVDFFVILGGMLSVGTLLGMSVGWMVAESK